MSLLGDDEGKKILGMHPAVVGHSIQAIFIVMAVGGPLILGYETIQGKLNAESNHTDLLKQRQEIDERIINDLQRRVQANENNVQTQLGQIIDRIASVKEAVAGLERANGRK